MLSRILATMDDSGPAGRSRGRRGDHEIATIVGVGRPARNVLDRTAADAIVLGAHGSDRDRAIRRFLAGSVAETVTKQAPTPVVR